ncbi:transcription elongation factor 1, partial [Blyttiomyces helicus]
MGKRKSSRKPQKRVKEVLDKEFSCVFCNHEKSIAVKIDSDLKVGHLSCRACGVTFQTITTALSEPIDVYSDWIDACE